MNLHIESLEHALLWLHNPNSATPLTSGDEIPWLQSQELVKLLQMADCKRDGGYESRAISPRCFAAKIANELVKELACLPVYLDPPTIKVADRLADALDIPKEPMLVEEFIRRFSVED